MLSPYLFNVYVDRISNSLNELNIGCNIDSFLLNHLFYADDLCIFAPSTRGLQLLIDMCVKIGTELDICFNAAKCNVMFFRCKYLKDCAVPNFYMGNILLSECDSFLYLGHFLTSDGTDDLDIKRQFKAIYARGNSLIRKFHMCSNYVKSLSFNSYCSSMYTCHLWRSYKQATFRKLNVAFHCSFKQFLNVSRYESNSLIFSTNRVNTCPEVIRKSIFSFYCRIVVNANEIISRITHSDHFRSSPLFLHWQKMLFPD